MKILNTDGWTSQEFHFQVNKFWLQVVHDISVARNHYFRCHEEGERGERRESVKENTFTYIDSLSDAIAIRWILSFESAKIFLFALSFSFKQLIKLKYIREWLDNVSSMDVSISSSSSRHDGISGKDWSCLQFLASKKHRPNGSSGNDLSLLQFLK